MKPLRMDFVQENSTSEWRAKHELSICLKKDDIRRTYPCITAWTGYVTTSELCCSRQHQESGHDMKTRESHIEKHRVEREGGQVRCDGDEYSKPFRGSFPGTVTDRIKDAVRGSLDVKHWAWRWVK